MKPLRMADCNVLLMETQGGQIVLRASRVADRVDIAFPDGSHYEMSRRLGTALARAFMSVIPQSISILSALPPSEWVQAPKADA